MTDAPIIRPRTGWSAPLIRFGLEHIAAVFAVFRRFFPILSLGEGVLVTRYDDVKTVFLTDATFAAPYAKKLAVIMGGKPFFLGMGDTPEYKSALAAMHAVVPVSDVDTRIGPETETAAARRLAAAGGRIETVGELFRAVTFEVLLRYFGVPAEASGDLRLWATRLFEFQFADPGDDPALFKDVEIMAPAMRAHVQAAINARRASGLQLDDVLGRCLSRQAAGDPDYSDDAIRCALVGFIVGGLPQPPMVGPNALEQLLRRPAQLAVAQQAARDGDDALLAAVVFEAMRFDPLAPVLPRVVLKDTVLAAGTPRARALKAGTGVMVSFASAMRDPRRVGRPETFDAGRPPSDYIHFGYGLHECFGIHINRRLVPAMMKPLLRFDVVRRAAGPEGRLLKQFIFADRLVVAYGDTQPTGGAGAPP